MPHAHCHIVEEAEPHGFVAGGMVPGRPDRAEGVVHLAGDHGIGGRNRRARRNHINIGSARTSNRNRSSLNNNHSNSTRGGNIRIINLCPCSCTGDCDSRWSHTIRQRRTRRTHISSCHVQTG